MRIEIPAEKKLVHESLMTIDWCDMDAYGHVNNKVYFRYMENARVLWFQSIYEKGGPLAVGAVVVNAFCNFYKQLTFPGSLRVKLYIANPGRSSFDTFVTMERDDQPGEMYAAGGATMVCTDVAKGQAIPVPPELLAYFA